MTALAESVAGAGGVAPDTPARPGRRGGGAGRFAVLGQMGLFFVVPVAA